MGFVGSAKEKVLLPSRVTKVSKALKKKEGEDIKYLAR